MQSTLAPQTRAKWTRGSQWLIERALLGSSSLNGVSLEEGWCLFPTEQDTIDKTNDLSQQQ